MGFLLIGVAITVITIIWDIKRHGIPSLLNGLAVLICFVSFIGGLVLGCVLPGTPYKNELICRIPIVSLSDGTNVSGGGNHFYIWLNSDNSYSYYYEVQSDFKQSQDEKSYKQGNAYGNNVTIIEYEEGSDEIPTLSVYESGTRPNFWTFDATCIRKYVFRVPKGTVAQRFELNGR